MEMVVLGYLHLLQVLKFIVQVAVAVVLIRLVMQVVPEELGAEVMVLIRFLQVLESQTLAVEAVQHPGQTRRPSTAGPAVQAAVAADTTTLVLEVPAPRGRATQEETGLTLAKFFGQPAEEAREGLEGNRHLATSGDSAAQE